MKLLVGLAINVVISIVAACFYVFGDWDDKT